MRVKLSYNRTDLCQSSTESFVAEAARPDCNKNELDQAYVRTTFGSGKDISPIGKALSGESPGLRRSSRKKERESCQNAPSTDVVGCPRMPQQIKGKTSSRTSDISSRQTRSGFKISSTTQNFNSRDTFHTNAFEKIDDVKVPCPEQMTTPSLESSGPSLSPEIPHTVNIDFQEWESDMDHAQQCFSLPTKLQDTAHALLPGSSKKKLQRVTKVEKSSEGFIVVGSNWSATTSSPVITVADLKSLLGSIDFSAPGTLLIEPQPMGSEVSNQEFQQTSGKVAPIETEPEITPVAFPRSDPVTPSGQLPGRQSVEGSIQASDAVRRSSGRQTKLSAKKKEAKHLNSLMSSRKRAANTEIKWNVHSGRAESQTPPLEPTENASGLKIRLKRPEISLKLHLGPPESPAEAVLFNAESLKGHGHAPLGPRKKRRPARYEASA